MNRDEIWGFAAGAVYGKNKKNNFLNQYTRRWLWCSKAIWRFSYTWYEPMHGWSSQPWGAKVVFAESTLCSSLKARYLLLCILPVLTFHIREHVVRRCPVCDQRPPGLTAQTSFFHTTNTQAPLFNFTFQPRWYMLVIVASHRQEIISTSRRYFQIHIYGLGQLLITLITRG